MTLETQINKMDHCIQLQNYESFWNICAEISPDAKFHFLSLWHLSWLPLLNMQWLWHLFSKVKYWKAKGLGDNAEAQAESFFCLNWGRQVPTTCQHIEQ